jgi:signal transduction histidine kinase
MAGLVPAIHECSFAVNEPVDARHEACPRAGLRPDPLAGHDEGSSSSLGVSQRLPRLLTFCPFVRAKIGPVLRLLAIDRPRFRPATPEAFAVAGVIAVAAMLLRLALAPWMMDVPFVTFFPAIIVATFLCGSAAALAASGLSLAAAWFLFLPHHFTRLSFFEICAFTVGSLTIAGVVAVMRATSDEVRRLNETLRRDVAARIEVEARLEEASRAKSEFLAQMSHELRTPLNAIIGFSEMIRDAAIGPVDARYREYGSDINSAGRHLQNIINDILDISKLEDGRLELRDEIVSIADTVEACRRIVAAMAEVAGVTLRVALPGALPLIRSDQLRFRQILLNLMSNGVKFTPAGGRVAVWAAVEDDGVVIAVEDTGIGMKPEDIPIALEPFRQIDGVLSRRFDGTGLGLPLANALVELHGGRLAVESAPGKGTVVRVLLPLERVVSVAA